MYKLTILSLLIFTGIMAGCAMLDRVAPARYDEEGKEIPFSREPTEFTKVVSENVPYGDVVLYSVLFAVGVWQKYKRTKVEKGLKATIYAGKKVAADPETKAMWEKVIEAYYRDAHKAAGVTELIKSFKAKTPEATAPPIK